MTYCLDRDWKFLGPEDFTRQHGRYWSPKPLPPGYRLGKLGQCGRNASRLAIRRPDLTYVEGYAIPNGWISPMEFYLGHSWVVDAEGNVIEVTWLEGGSEYFGVPFETTYVAEVCKKSRATPTLIERWWEDFPLLRTLGTKPERWFSKKYDLSHGPRRFRRTVY